GARRARGRGGGPTRANPGRVRRRGGDRGWGRGRAAREGGGGARRGQGARLGRSRRPLRRDPRRAAAGTLAAVSIDRLEETYRRHHAASRAPSFVFAGPERSAAFHEWVGTGKRVLDLGCRYGALTQ